MRAGVRLEASAKIDPSSRCDVCLDQHQIRPVHEHLFESEVCAAGQLNVDAFGFEKRHQRLSG